MLATLSQEPSRPTEASGPQKCSAKRPWLARRVASVWLLPGVGSAFRGGRSPFNTQSPPTKAAPASSTQPNQSQAGTNSIGDQRAEHPGNQQPSWNQWRFLQAGGQRLDHTAE